VCVCVCLYVCVGVCLCLSGRVCVCVCVWCRPVLPQHEDSICHDPTALVTS